MDANHDRYYSPVLWQTFRKWVNQTQPPSNWLTVKALKKSLSHQCCILHWMSSSRFCWRLALLSARRSSECSGSRSMARCVVNSSCRHRQHSDKNSSSADRPHTPQLALLAYGVSKSIYLSVSGMILDILPKCKTQAFCDVYFIFIALLLCFVMQNIIKT